MKTTTIKNITKKELKQYKNHTRKLIMFEKLLEYDGRTSVLQHDIQLFCDTVVSNGKMVKTNTNTKKPAVSDNRKAMWEGIRRNLILSTGTGRDKKVKLNTKLRNDLKKATNGLRGSDKLTAMKAIINETGREYVSTHREMFPELV